MIAGDTDEGSTISSDHARKQNKLFEILPDIVLASTACTCLTNPFIKSIEAKLEAMPTGANKNLDTVIQIVDTLMPSYAKIHKEMATVVVGFIDNNAVAYNFNASGYTGPLNFTVAGGCETEFTTHAHRLVHMKTNDLFKQHPDVEKQLVDEFVRDAFSMTAVSKADLIGNTLQIGHLCPGGFKTEKNYLKAVV